MKTQSPDPDYPTRIRKWLADQNRTQIIVSIDTTPYTVSHAGIWTASPMACIMNPIEHEPPTWLIDYIKSLETSFKNNS